MLGNESNETNHPPHRKSSHTLISAARFRNETIASSSCGATNVGIPGWGRHTDQMTGLYRISPPLLRKHSLPSWSLPYAMQSSSRCSPKSPHDQYPAMWFHTLQAFQQHSLSHIHRLNPLLKLLRRRFRTWMCEMPWGWGSGNRLVYLGDPRQLIAAVYDEKFISQTIDGYYYGSAIPSLLPICPTPQKSTLRTSLSAMVRHLFVTVLGLPINVVMWRDLGNYLVR